MKTRDLTLAKVDALENTPSTGRALFMSMYLSTNILICVGLVVFLLNACQHLF
jgi:hypothetical protein